MWRGHTQSWLRDRRDLDCGHHFVTEVASEEASGAQVDVVADVLAELVLRANHANEGDLSLRRELHQHITSLSGPKSSRSADPKNARRWMGLRRQNSRTRS